MRSVLLAAAAASILTGCANAERHEYDASVASYRECLQAKGPAGCEREKALLALNERVYKDKLAATNPTARSYNVNVRSTN